MPLDYYCCRGSCSSLSVSSSPSSARLIDRCAKAEPKYEEIELKCYQFRTGYAIIDQNNRYKVVAAPKQAAGREPISRRLDESRELLDERPDSVSLIKLKVDTQSGRLDERAGISISKLAPAHRCADEPEPEPDRVSVGGATTASSSGIASSLESAAESSSGSNDNDDNHNHTSHLGRIISERIGASEIDFCAAIDEVSNKVGAMKVEAKIKECDKEAGKDNAPMGAGDKTRRNSRARSRFAPKLKRRLHRILNYARCLSAAQPTGSPRAQKPEPESGPLRAADRETCNPQPPFTVMISYQRAEGQDYALALRSELQRLGVSVYVDLFEIQIGSDWQDSLNAAILNCRAFVALVTPSYGETLWTSREVKLADVLAKRIIPVNFGQCWPPASLAIQFATLQYIPWLELAPGSCAKANINNNDKDTGAPPLMDGPTTMMTTTMIYNNDADNGAGRRQAAMPKWPAQSVAEVARKIVLALASGHELEQAAELGAEVTMTNGPRDEPATSPSLAETEEATCASDRRRLVSDRKLARAYSGHDSSSSAAAAAANLRRRQSPRINNYGAIGDSSNAKCPLTGGRRTKAPLGWENWRHAEENRGDTCDDNRAVAVVTPQRQQQQAVTTDNGYYAPKESLQDSTSFTNYCHDRALSVDRQQQQQQRRPGKETRLSRPARANRPTRGLHSI